MTCPDSCGEKTTPNFPEDVSLEFLYEYLTKDLERVQKKMDAAFDVRGDLMQQVADFLRQGRGKMLRPSLVCLAARAHGLDGDVTDGHISLAASIELFHVATLLHDDVIDKAPTRRGRQTVNAKWGDDVAILMADYLYATSFDLALSTLHPETLRVLARTTQRMTEGEMLQIERRGDWLSVEDYMEIITNKTAHLFSAATSLGALIAGAPLEGVKQMARFGLEFGLAFQITDDTLDYEAQKDRWGKRVGADLAEGKQTLPLLRTLMMAEDADREEILSILNNGRDFESIHRIVHRYGAIEYSLEVASNHATSAAKSLAGLDEELESVRLLRQIADSVTVRQY